MHISVCVLRSAPPHPLKKSRFDFSVQIVEKRFGETNEKRRKNIPIYILRVMVTQF